LLPRPGLRARTLSRGEERLKVDVGGLAPVEKTALLTLYARALDSRCRQPILSDNVADQVIGKLDYDFDALRVRASVRCPVALRAKMLDERVRQFTTVHPDAVVVDLGAGLSDAIGRTRPPATVDWYNVDLPAIVALRAKVLPAREQEVSIAARIGDPGWAQRIPPDRPTMLVADGLTGFLTEQALVDLMLTVTAHFRTGEFAFNDYGRIGWASRTAMRFVPQGTGRAFANAGFADAHQPESWNPELTLVDEASLTDAPEVEVFPWHLRLAARAPALARKWRILHYRFPATR
jgi:O-methyltransferase involved in polyketide biosynthesis